MAYTELSDCAEIWKPIPSCPGIEASSFGQLRRAGTKRILGQHLDNGYYVTVVNGDRYRKRTSVLVCEAFHGPRPAQDQLALHCNGNRSTTAQSTFAGALSLKTAPTWGARHGPSG